MSRIPLRLSMVAVVCLITGGCLPAQDVAPKYDYGESAPPRKESEETTVAQPKRRHVPEEAFAKLDEDGDGALNLAEYTLNRRAPAARQQSIDVFRFCDRNGDGKLSLEEYKTKPPQARFRQIDVDGNGGLSVREFYEGEMALATGEQARKVFGLVDRDDDESVSFEEYQNRTTEARLAKIDEDVDGQLSLREFEKAHKDLAAAGRSQLALEAIDRDGDGKLSGEEYTKRPQEATFIFRDKNGDHQLSLEEFVSGRVDKDPLALRSDYEAKDTDSDGVLTFREYAYAPADEDFWAMDRDGDARLRWEELAGTGEPPATATAEPADQRLRSLFGEIDQNGDELMCLEEFRARRNDLTFYCRDADRDRRLTAEEFKGGLDDTPEAVAEAEKIFQFKDQDADAKLTFEEYKSYPAEMKFWRMDTDGDEALDVEEFREGDPSLAAVAEKAFQLKDQDADAKLTLQEYKSYPAELKYLRMDTDGDGALDVEEFHQGDMSSATVEHARRVFSVLDGNDDARVSFEEFQATSQELRYARIDEDANEQLSLEEFEKGHKPLVEGGRSQPAFAAMDRNGDGGLTVEEFVKRPKEADFQFRDRDNDHKLSLEEYGQWRRNQDPASIQADYEKKDLDADGLLTLREYIHVPADNDFWAMDRDGDVRVSWAELAGTAEPPATATAEPADERLRKLFAEIDQNGDELMCLEEFRARRNDLRFYCRDADRDRWLSIEEFKGDFDDTPEGIAEAEKIFGFKDKNADAKLTFQEYKNAPPQMLHLRMDTDGDALLNLDEFHKGDMASASAEQAAAVFALLDQDKDGKLNFAEFRSRPSEAWFLRTDADEDGYCSFDEYMAVNGGPARKKFCLASFTAMDRDADLTLNSEEFCNTSAEASFHRRDRNTDGMLTVEEYVAWSPTPEKIAEARADFKQRDANENGRLDLREHLYRAADNDFWAADQNGNLLVDFDEFERRMLVEGDEAAGAKLKEIFNAIDQNGDGSASLAEFKWQSAETRFGWFDLNQDARLTVDEFVGNLENAEAITQAENAFKNRDQDGNDTLSVEEFSGGGN